MDYEATADKYAADADRLLIRMTRSMFIAELQTAERNAAVASAQGTPASRWREKGEIDPHGTRYDCERASTAGGHLTDDEVANAVFLDPSIQNLTIAKDRIRWLSRKLAEALAERQTLSEQERHAVEHARFQVDRATPDDPECCFDFELVRTLVQIIDRRSPENTNRDEVARIIDGVAFRPQHINGPFNSETEKEKWLRARNVAYYKADQIVGRQSPTASASDIERAFTDVCDELGCKYDNEAALEAIDALKRQSPAASGNLSDKPLWSALEAISRTTFSGSEMDEAYMRGNRDAHATCARMAKAVLRGRSQPETDAEVFMASNAALTSEVLQLRAQVERLLSGLSSALGYMRNADIDLSTGAPKKTAQATIRGGIKMAEQIMGEHGDSLAITSTESRDA